MASVSSVGIGSGVLTSELIENLASAERAPVEARLDSQEADVNAELSIFGQIKSAITDLRLPSRTLANPELFESKTVSSGNSAFSAVVDSNDATPSVHTLEVTALAVSQTLTSTEFNDSDTTAIGEGSLTIVVDGKTTNVTIDNSNNTLDGIAAAINSESDVGMTASVLYTGTGYKLVFNADETGLDKTIDISVSDTGDASNTDANGLSRLAYTAGATNLIQSQPAADASFKLNGVPITRSSNEIYDAIPGLTLTLSGTNDGSPAALSVQNDHTAVVEKVSEFVEKFNALQTLVNDNSEFDPSGGAEAGILLGDSTTRSMMNQVRRVLGSTVGGLENANVRSLADIGITTDYQTGLLSLNEDTLSDQLDSHPDDVSALFSDQGRASDAQVSFGTASINTKPGSYDINITTAATRGELSGAVSLGASTTIDANNDEFTISIDGTESGSITLDAGSYT
ncbi:flagellar filament capping protein FliD, partial [Oleiphilus sp. HI0117]